MFIISRLVQSRGALAVKSPAGRKPEILGIISSPRGDIDSVLVPLSTGRSECRAGKQDAGR